MTRVGTYGQQQLLLFEALKSQDRLLEAQRQVVTGHKSSDFAGIAEDVTSLVLAKSQLSELEGYEKLNGQLKLKLSMYSNSMQTLNQMASDFETEMLSAGSGELPDEAAATQVMTITNNMFTQIKAIANSRVAGEYIFGGSRTDTPPIALTNASDYTTGSMANIAVNSAAGVALTFANDTQKAQAVIDRNYTITYGVPAASSSTTDPGPFKEFLGQVTRVMQYNAGALPAADAYQPGTAFGNPLSTTDKNFLHDVQQQMKTAMSSIQRYEAENGLVGKASDAVARSIGDQITYTREYIGELKDVDQTEAITDLNLARTAMEAGLRTLAQVNQLSLMNFI